MKNWRRYEVLLPVRFNDGARIPKALLAQTILELEERFGAVSCETQVIHGRWRSGALMFRDDMIRVFVDVEQDPEVRQYLPRVQGAGQSTVSARGDLAHPLRYRAHVISV